MAVCWAALRDARWVGLWEPGWAERWARWKVGMLVASRVVWTAALLVVPWAA
jgi:hypothetical protein